MKKIIALFILVLAFSNLGNAQLGFRGGVNLSNQSYSNTANSGFETSGKIGYLIGINYKIDFSGPLALRTGVEYALKGTEIQLNGTDANSNFEYLEVPIDVIFSSGNIAVYAGPYLAFLTSAKSGTIDLKPDIKSMDAGLNIGFEINISRLGIGAKYGLGISDIGDYKVGDIAIKNNVLSLYASITL